MENEGDRLLTTREAAAFLKVSEASIRRWTDSGLLPTSRVGQRQARRIREIDLKTFMQASPASTIALQGLVIPLGSHVVTFYTSDGGRLRVGLPLMRDGLLVEQTVLLRALPDVREHYFRALREEGIDVADALRRELLMLYPEAPGSARDQVAAFEQAFMAAARKRPGPIRVVAEVLADIEAVGSVAEHLIVEQQVAPLVKRFPVVVLCAYDVRTMDGGTVVEALKLHSDIFGREVGYWLS